MKFQILRTVMKMSNVIDIVNRFNNIYREYSHVNFFQFLSKFKINLHKICKNEMSNIENRHENVKWK